jgi:hypothetical protein
VIASPNFSARGKAPVRLVVIHTAEGARTTASLGAFFAKKATGASSHTGIDDKGIEQYVPYDKTAWTIRSANGISDNVELCGFAKWTRAQWLDEHTPMLRLCAQWIRERCTARGIPIKKLTPAEVAAGKAGVIGHVDWTVGMKDGSHTDPGPGFPWDVVIGWAANTTTTATEEKPDMDARQAAQLAAVLKELTGNPEPGNFSTPWPTWAGGTDEKFTVVDYLRRANVEVRQGRDQTAKVQGTVDKLQATVDTLVAALKAKGVI